MFFTLILNHHQIVLKSGSLSTGIFPAFLISCGSLSTGIGGSVCPEYSHYERLNLIC